LTIRLNNISPVGLVATVLLFSACGSVNDSPADTAVSEAADASGTTADNGRVGRPRIGDGGLVTADEPDAAIDAVVIVVAPDAAVVPDAMVDVMVVPKCTEAQVRPSKLVCGLNGEGFFSEECKAAEWTVTSTCSGTDVCVNASTGISTTACGLNGNGFFSKVCTAGQWVTSATCVDPDLCKNGDQKNSDVKCGLNDEGVVVDQCAGGTWKSSGVCTGTSACKNSTLRDVSCGLNGVGVRKDVCNAGVWVQSVACVDPDICVNNSTQAKAGVCGFNKQGTYANEVCNNGKWSASNCVIPEQVRVCSTTATCGITSTLNGRTLSATQVNLNGSGSNVAVVAPGQNVTFAIKGAVANDRNACPTCVTQFYARVNGVFSLCLGSSTDTFSVDTSGSFKAPTTPGIYYINPAASWQFNCETITTAPTALSRDTLATLIVRLPPEKFTALGRSLTVASNVLQGTGTDWAVVKSGATTTFALKGSVVNNSTDCPNCITQMNSRINGVMTMCLGSSTGNFAANTSTQFAAPATPGIYFVNPHAEWQLNCVNEKTVTATMNPSTQGFLITY
jgi:hypothetical protein